ncbi:glutaredoxin-like protein NrdH [uncultured Bifidobacterium sp.]|uniref:glutaredoxin-like protein NrdH n=1 Tax=uncultured Bifidobacterium sp. TaxID=165187 RepID=UPI0028DCE4E3|nr:glutaredoxin-like protein NrdH [uncultured Bifidobacterium sp.]
MTVTVYAKPRCVQCEATKRQLTRQGIGFDVVDVTSDAAALARIKAAGFLQAPVVMTEDASWSGYRPDLIRELAKQPHQVLA